MLRIGLIGSEISAFASAVLALPFERFLCRDTIDVTKSSRERPVILIHGLLGNRVHFRALRRALEAEGTRRFATFCYRPRIDYQRLSPELGAFIAKPVATGDLVRAVRTLKRRVPQL